VIDPPNRGCKSINGTGEENGKQETENGKRGTGNRSPGGFGGSAPKWGAIDAGGALGCAQDSADHVNDLDHPNRQRDQACRNVG
jgi:hypothetical protein